MTGTILKILIGVIGGAILVKENRHATVGYAKCREKVAAFLKGCSVRTAESDKCHQGRERGSI